MGLLAQPHGFETLLSVVVVVDADDHALADRIDERVLALDLDAAPPSLCVHANKDHDRVASIHELVRLDAPFSPGGSPILKPASNALVPLIIALVRGVVVI